MAYEKSGQRGGYEIKETKNGYMVSFWSRMQGEKSGTVYLVKFNDDFVRGMDMGANWNDYVSNGEALVNFIHQNYIPRCKGIKMLKKGEVVR